MEEKIQKPIILEIEDTKLEFIQVINNALQVRKLPCYFVDMILTELHGQIKEGAKNELEILKKQTEEQRIVEEKVEQ